MGGKIPRREGAENATEEESSQLDGTAAIMAELRAGFQSIYTRLDMLTIRLDDIHGRLEAQDTRISGAEQ